MLLLLQVIGEIGGVGGQGQLIMMEDNGKTDN